MSIAYVLRRLGVFVIIVWAAATINFVVPRLAPGDPVQAMLGTMEAQGGKVEDSAKLIQAYRAQFGLDEPILVQYVKYLASMARLDLGYSLALFPARVTDVIKGGLPYTIALLTTTTILSFALGVVAGALMVWRATPRALRLGLPLVMALAPIPYYLLAMVLIFVFAFALRWFPFTGIVSTGRVPGPGFDLGYSLDMVYHSILPALSIILASVGGWALGMRGMMVTVQGEDYLTLAEAKGLRQRRVFARYGLRNAMLPQFTHLAISLGHVVAGAALVEVIFGYPGLGTRLFQAISRADYTVIQGITFILVLSVALAILIIDLLYPRLDPRITYSRR